MRDLYITSTKRSLEIEMFALLKEIPEPGQCAIKHFTSWDGPSSLMAIMSMEIDNRHVEK